MIEVRRAGPLITVQDLGRPGWAHLGVPRSGALDAPALRLGNRLVGNPEPAAGLEVTLTGCTLVLRAGRVVAVTGAPAQVTVDGRPVASGAAVRVPAGSVLRVGPAREGVRSYLAVAGGIAVPPVLGSRSTDTFSGLGPAPLRDGDLLPLGDPPAGEVSPVEEPGEGSVRRLCSAGFVGAEPACEPGPARVRLLPGPRADWFTEEAVGMLDGASYTVGVNSNRVAARLAGQGLTRAVAGELPSEGVVLGAVQVPPDGQPLVFLADHPTTGGYPVVAIVEPADLPLLAQARPGATVTFHGPQQRPG
ncbi:MAG TPA: biotin-dependent carboxyltransferase family protein [Micromonosporaceae bacterium]|nr:biotin-dependent carboxyltransferase family protein [Micromonosporaceae bacterium]